MSAVPAVGLPRLARVELRKMRDTRAGFWLLAGGVALAVLVAALSIFDGSEGNHTLDTVFGNTTQALTLLLPILGILLVTSEWSQRTAQVTFTLVPRRGRVLAAKLLASVLLALAATAIALVIALAFTALNPSSLDGAWSLDASLVLQTTLLLVLMMVMGAAFGAAILLSAPAIVAWFLLPTAYGALLAIIGGLDGLSDWTSRDDALSPLTDHALSATEWARLGTTLLLWLALPLAIGAWRFLRGEIR